MITRPGTETLALRRVEDIVLCRQRARDYSIRLGFSLVEQTKMVTAASELARNTVVHGGGGEVTIEVLDVGGRRGLRMTFADQGPGIPDVGQAMTDGYTTSRGLGLGLGGARRLVNEFEITSRAGEGTRVAVTRWK